MEAKNFRVGNHVLTATPGMPIKIPSFRASVQGITLLGELMFCHRPDSQGFKTHTNHVCGIDLVCEDLVNFGFIKDSEWSYRIPLQTHYLELIPSEQHWYPVYAEVHEMSHQDEQRVGLNRIRFVHELQNLFFTLTGKELEIKT